MGRWDITGNNRIMKLRVLFVFAFLSCSVFGYSQYWVPNFVDGRSSSNSGSSNNQVRSITATYAYEEDIERYGGDVWVISFTSNGRVVKCNYKRDNYRRVIDWNASYDYGSYMVTDSNSSRTRIDITWSNGRTENCTIKYIAVPLKRVNSSLK